MRRRNLLLVLLALPFLVLIRTAVLSDHADFAVFYRAASRLREGASLYVNHREGAQLFKYPPWIGPLLLPLAVLDEATSAILWRLLQVALLAWVVWRLLLPLPREGRLAVAWVFFTFLGVWNYNVLTGQTTIAILALGLLPVFSAPAVAAGPRPWAAVLQILGLSTKVFPVLGALPLLVRSPFRLRILGGAALGAALLSVPALLGIPSHSPWELFQEFRASASANGGNLLGAQNGLSALLASLMGLPTLNVSPSAQTGPVLISVILALGAWLWARRRLPGLLEETALALALSQAVTPLSFNYGLGLTFPWFALQVARVFRMGPRQALRSWGGWSVLLAWAWVLLPLPYRALAVFLSLFALGS